MLQIARSYGIAARRSWAASVPRWPAVRIAHRGKRKKSWGESLLSPQLYLRFLLPRNLPGDISLTRANCLVFVVSNIADRGSRGTKPKRRLWRMKRGVVLNRNKHSSGSEKATIEVAEPLLPGSGGCSARKICQWQIFSEGGPEGPGSRRPLTSPHNK